MVSLSFCGLATAFQKSLAEVAMVKTSSCRDWPSTRGMMMNSRRLVTSTSPYLAMYLVTCSLAAVAAASASGALESAEHDRQDAQAPRAVHRSSAQHRRGPARWCAHHDRPEVRRFRSAGRRADSLARTDNRRSLLRLPRLH